MKLLLCSSTLLLLWTIVLTAANDVAPYGNEATSTLVLLNNTVDNSVTNSKEAEEEEIGQKVGIPSCWPKTIKKFDVYISYSRANGAQFASVIKAELKKRKYEAFLEIEDVCLDEIKEFPANLEAAVTNAKHVIVLFTKDSLRPEFFVVGNAYMHKEILLAKENTLNIIPVHDDTFNWNEDWKAKDIPADLKFMEKYNAVAWNHDYQGAAADKIARFIKNPQRPASA